MAKHGARKSGSGVVHRGGKKNRKHGRQKRHPAFVRYWKSDRLERRKIRNLVRCCGMNEHEAWKFWHGIE